MPDIVLSDKMLKEAVSLYQDNVQKTEVYSDQVFETSQAFEKKMQKLIKCEDNLFYKMTLTSTRKAICVAAIIIMLLLSTLSVGAVRRAVASFFTDIFDGYNVITTDTNSVGDYPETIKKSYIPTALPSDYELVEKVLTDKTTYYCYDNGDNTIIFEQFTMERFFLYVDNKDSSFNKRVYKGQEYYTQNYKGESHSIMWNDSEYVFVLISHLSENDLLKISTSLKSK